MIYGFKDEYAWLSNFYTCNVEYDNIVFLNAESAYQCAKCRSPEDKLIFPELTAREAKRIGKLVKLRADWNNIKDDIMYDVVKNKFIQNEDLKKKLISTKGDLIEANSWGDTYWGVSDVTGKGENKLGKILMRLRDELIKGGAYA